ncbi:MAG TPA: GNAT family N-acetyltransferase [Armatimonadota bacterium]|jgi:GNAT superfamily N-acetyltransferase
MVERGPPIREAGPEDAEGLAELIRVSFAEVAERHGLTSDNCPSHPSFCTPEWVRRDLERGSRFFVAELDGGAIGCVSLGRGHHAPLELRRLAVAPAHRHRGLGERLVHRALEEAWASGARSVEIGIIADDFRLRRWYEALGFRLLRTCAFSHLPFEVAILVAAADGAAPLGAPSASPAAPPG